MKKILFAAAALTIASAAVAQSGQTVSDPSQSTGSRGITQQGTNPSDQACTPPGFNQSLSVYPQCGAVARPTHGGDYPPCTRQVTDHCVQTYERGVARGARRR